MGLHYLGNGFLTGIPRRDMTDAEVSALGPPMEALIRASRFYMPIDDADVGKERLDWTTQRESWPRVLMYTPTLRWEKDQAVAAQANIMDYPGVVDWFVTRDNPYPLDDKRGYRNILHNTQRARQMVLDGGYDALFVLESDIVPPPDALRRLVQIEADVAGGLYPLRGYALAVNLMCYVPGTPVALVGIEIPEMSRLAHKQTRANGVCMGCTLIWRHVLEHIEFRLEEEHLAAPDWWFMVDAHMLGFTTVCDLSVMCGHREPDGQELRVDVNGIVTKKWPT